MRWLLKSDTTIRPNEKVVFVVLTTQKIVTVEKNNLVAESCYLCDYRTELNKISHVTATSIYSNIWMRLIPNWSDTAIRPSLNTAVEIGRLNSPLLSPFDPNLL